MIDEKKIKEINKKVKALTGLVKTLCNLFLEIGTLVAIIKMIIDSLD